MNNTPIAQPSQPPVSSACSRGKKKKKKHWHEKFTCRMRRKVYCWFVLWYVAASRSSDKQQIIFFRTSGKRKAMVTDRQDRSSSQSGGQTPANLNKERQREEGSEGRGKTWLGSTPAQTLPTMMWNEKWGLYFTHKGIISPSNCLWSSNSEPNHLQLLKRVMDGIFFFCFVCSNICLVMPII